MMHNPPRVLITDDDSQLQDLFATKLKVSGFEVLQAYNGEEGYELAKKDQPDLILLDLRMPVMDGAETLAKLSSDPITKTIKVIILSSFNDWSAMKLTPEAAKAMGALDFVEKGIDLNELVRKITGILGMGSGASQS